MPQLLLTATAPAAAAAAVTSLQSAIALLCTHSEGEGRGDWSWRPVPRVSGGKSKLPASAVAELTMRAELPARQPAILLHWSSSLRVSCLASASSH